MPKIQEESLLPDMHHFIYNNFARLLYREKVFY